MAEMDESGPKSIKAALILATSDLPIDLVLAEDELKTRQKQNASPERIKDAEAYVSNLRDVEKAVQEGNPVPVLAHIKSRLVLEQTELDMLSKASHPRAGQQKRMRDLTRSIKRRTNDIKNVEAAIARSKN